MTEDCLISFSDVMFASPWGGKKVLALETWFVIANLLACDCVPSPAGWAVEAGVGHGCR